MLPGVVFRDSGSVIWMEAWGVLTSGTGVRYNCCNEHGSVVLELVVL